MTIGQKFRPKMISAPKQPHAWTIFLWCQWPLRKKEKCEHKYMYIYIQIYIDVYPLFELIDCVQYPDVDDGASSLSVIVCIYVCASVIIPVCGLQNFSRRCLTAPALFLISDGDIIAQRYLYFPWINKYVRDMYIFLHNFCYRSLSHELLKFKF